MRDMTVSVRCLNCKSWMAVDDETGVHVHIRRAFRLFGKFFVITGKGCRS